ncbi:MAG: hypothetical protein HQK54_09940 [Oligoflexales bacterium]|nr:hypothetical protein [Oligoflexales bacterium]
MPLPAIWSFCLVVANSVCYGESSLSAGRKNLQKDYINQEQNNPSPFGSTPISHISPNNNNVTVAGTMTRYNVMVVPESEDISRARDGQNIKLEVGGWDSSMMINFSTLALGAGLVIEGGRTQVHYLEDVREIGYYQAGMAYYESFSAAQFNGGGALIFYQLPRSIIPEKVNFTVMLGISELSVNHKTDGGRLADYPVDLMNFYYKVMRTHAGGDLRIVLSTIFDINIWYNYLAVKMGKLRGSIPEGSYCSLYGNDPQLEADQEIFWKSAPRQRLGVDFILKVSKINVNVGGLLGYLGALGTQPKNIYNGTISLGASMGF